MQSVSIIGVGRVGGAIALSLPPETYSVKNLIFRGIANAGPIAAKLTAAIVSSFDCISEISTDIIFVQSREMPRKGLNIGTGKCAGKRRGSALLAEILDTEGYVSLLATSGTEAFDMLGRVRPAAILLDLLMPGMDGFELLTRIKEDRSLRNLPVLVLTAKHLTNQDIQNLAGKTRGIFLKGNKWKEALLDQLRLAVNEG